MKTIPKKMHLKMCVFADFRQWPTVNTVVRQCWGLHKTLLMLYLLNLSVDNININYCDG